MTLMRFVYRRSDGETTLRRLQPWTEVGHYIEGFDHSAGKFCTFRKDRVVEYVDGAEALLADPHSPPPPRVDLRRPRDTRPQVLFTGFASVQRGHLEALADAGGLRVVKTVTQGLTFLCAGPNAGPSKVAQARLQKVYVMNQAELASLLETGELPDHAIDD